MKKNFKRFTDRYHFECSRTGDRRRRRRQLKRAGVIAAFTVLSAGSLWYVVLVRTDHPQVILGDAAQHTPSGEGDAVVTVVGSTKTGMDPVRFAIDFLEDTSLCVEKVYLSDGDSVAEGARCIEFTDESIAQARAELDRSVQSAELAYQSRVISDRESRIQAKYTYDMAVLEAEFAPQIYEDTIAQLAVELDRAEKEFARAQEAYNAYYAAVENNTFYADYQIAELKKAYDDAYDLFVSRRAYWEVTPEELGSLSGGGDSLPDGQGDRQWIVRTTALLRDEMTEARQEYEQARQEYQREIEGAELKLQKLRNASERAQQSLIDAQIAQQKGSFHARTVCEMAIARGQTAQKEYEACLDRLAGELKQQEDAKNEAGNKKALFEQLAGDGCLYAEREGSISMICAAEGQELAGGDMLFAYCSPETKFVSAAVPREDAAALFAGESAVVTIADCGSYDGVVEMIQHAAPSDGIAPVFDTVLLSLAGDVSAVESDLEATVSFGGTVQCSAAAGSGAGDSQTQAAPMYDLDIYAPEEEPAQFLRVEAVYLRAGEHIADGDPVCSFTPESVAEAGDTLDRALAQAETALIEAQAAYQLGVLKAGLDHNEAMADRSLAQAAYDNTIAKLNSTMEAKKLAVEQLLSDIYQIQLSLTDAGYQERRAEITRAYDKAKKQVEKTRESFVTSQLEAAECLREAQEAYEAFFAQSERSNRQIAAKIEEVHALQEEILQSQMLLEKELLAAQQAHNSAKVEGDTAAAKYADTVKKYEAALLDAQEKRDAAAQRLDAFRQLTADTTVRARGSGTVTEVGCIKGGLLTDARRLVSFVADVVEKEDTQ